MNYECEFLVALHPELFEGLRFEFVKPLNEQFGLTHRLVLNVIDDSRKI